MRRIAGLFRDLPGVLPRDLPGVRGASCAASAVALQPLPSISAAAPSRLAPFVLDCTFFSRRLGLHLFLHLEPPLPSPSRATRCPSSAARLRADHLLSFVVPTPRGVGGAPGGALSVRSRLRGATTALARRGPSRAIGTAPRGAPPWRFSARDPRRAISDSARRMRAAPLPAAGPQGPAGGVPNLPRLRFAPQRGDATPRSACKTSPETPLMSGDMRYLA